MATSVQAMATRLRALALRGRVAVWALSSLTSSPEAANRGGRDITDQVGNGNSGPLVGKPSCKTCTSVTWKTHTITDACSICRRRHRRHRSAAPRMTLRLGKRYSTCGLAASWANPRQRYTRRVETSVRVRRPQWRPTPSRHTPLPTLSPQKHTIDQTTRTGLQLQRLVQSRSRKGSLPTTAARRTPSRRARPAPASA